MTFEEGCNKYLDNCRARNLREGTINHYKQSYTQFYRYFDKNMQVSDIDEGSISTSKIYSSFWILVIQPPHFILLYHTLCFFNNKKCSKYKFIVI